MKVVFGGLCLLLRLPFAGAAFTAGSSLALCQRRPHISHNCCGHALFVTAAAAVEGSDDESRAAINSLTDGTATHRHSLGLLRGVDTTVDNFYADEIDMSKEGLAWLRQPGLMWEAAKKDAAEKAATKAAAEKNAAEKEAAEKKAAEKEAAEKNAASRPMRQRRPIQRMTAATNQVILTAKALLRLITQRQKLLRRAWIPAEKDAAEKDAAEKYAAEKGVPVEKYIEEVETNIRRFRNSKIIYDRQELLMCLNGAFTAKKSFTLLLGGKNVGKSTVLKSLAREANKKSELLVLYVDARLCPGRLNDGLANGIAQLAADQVLCDGETEDWIGVVKTFRRRLGEKAIDVAVSKFDPEGEKNGHRSSLRGVLEIIDDSIHEKRSGDDARVSQMLIRQFIEIAEHRNAFPVLVIDEADLVLGVERNGKPDNQTMSLLTNFVSFTKQDGRMNVILVSTEHAYPYRLERQGFNLLNVDMPIFAGEIPPKEMWKLLVNAKYEEGDHKGKVIIGMGPHLAELCLAAFGGHFMIVQQAIRYLSLEQDKAELSSFLPDLRSEIIKCLKTNNESRPLLEAMAKDGVAPIEEIEDSAAELISKEKVGGVVTQNAVCIGISETKWERTEFTNAVIPSSQCVRLRIAQVLLTRPLKIEKE